MNPLVPYHRKTLLDRIDALVGANRRAAFIREAVEAELKRVRAERIDLKQEIGDLHIEIRALRPDRKNRQDRAND